MGQSLKLQAVPTVGRLHAQITTDRQAGAVFGHILMHAGHPSVWQREQDGELEEVFDDLATWPLLGSRAAVDRAMDELAAGWQATRAEHPGLEERCVFLGKTQYDIERMLADDFRRRGHPTSDGFAGTVVFGTDHLAPHGMDPAPGCGMRVNPPVAVAEMARWLGPVPDAAPGSWIGPDFGGLRRLYIAAAGRGEAVLVGSGYTQP
jgi:hypothetical protein